MHNDKNEVMLGKDDLGLIYKKNLSSLQIKDPLLFRDLQNITTNVRYEIFMGNDVANFNIIDTQSNVPLYNSSPLEEIKQKLSELNKYRYYPYLYFYGLGNGVLFSIMLSNKTLKRIVIIEPELEIIYIVLNLIDFSEEILSNKIILLHSKYCNLNMINSLFNIDKSSKIYSKIYDLMIVNNYYEIYKDEIIKINQDFIKCIEHNVISVGNDSRDAIIGIKHHIENLKHVLSNPTLLNLHSKIYSRDTAIIVATGPSLYKQLPLLKEIAPFATLFCIDASFPILYQYGIKPDIVFTLERVKESAKFYIDTPKDAQKDVIFELTSIVHEDTINAITDGIKSFSFRPFGYTSIFKIPDLCYLGIGMSAANMAYELVVYSHFKRCIIIGQDLAFGSDGSSHSKGAVYGENEISPKENKENKIFVEKYGGGGVVETTSVWKMFLNFYEKDIANTPYDLAIINSTEGGARISGAIEMSFKDACDLIPKIRKKPIMLEYPDSEFTSKYLKSALDICNDLLQYGKKWKSKIENVFLILVKFLEDTEALHKDNKLENIEYDRMDKIIESIDEIKDEVNGEKFQSYFNDATQSYIFHQELDIAKILVKPIENEMDKRAKQLDWIYHHRYWLFSLAGGLDAVLIVVEKAMSKLIIDI